MKILVYSSAGCSQAGRLVEFWSLAAIRPLSVSGDRNTKRFQRFKMKNTLADYAKMMINDLMVLKIANCSIKK